MGRQIAVFGTGYLGATHAVCMAELGHDVLGVDVESGKLAKLGAGEAPFYEPGLDEILKTNVDAGSCGSVRRTRKPPNLQTRTSLRSRRRRSRASLGRI